MRTISVTFAPSLVGIAVLVLEILLLFIVLQISLLDHSPKGKWGPHGLWGPPKSVGVKKLNWLKKFMQVEVDLKCMQANFGGCGLSSFGDFAPFQN